MSDTTTTLPPLPRGLERGEAYALGLRDGSCPVGVVLDGDADGVTVTLFHWLVGMFCGSDEWIAAETILRWRRAELLPDSAKRQRGYAADQVVRDMDPLADFQREWKSRAEAEETLAP